MTAAAQKGGAALKGSLSCLHTHTTFCDGTADVETMCAAAHAKGFVSLGFSSHAPVGKKTGLKTDWHLPDDRLDAYIDAVLEAKRRWEGRLRVYLGLEVDYIRGLSGPADRDIRELPLDYVIGAVHYVLTPRGRLLTVEGPDEEFSACLADFDNDGMALCNAYYDAYCGLIEEGGSDILAHMDMVKKNNAAHCFFSPEDPRYVRRLLETAEKAGAAVLSRDTAFRRPAAEINTGGIIRGRTAGCYPSEALLRLLRKKNVPVTISSDAHSPEQLGGAYDIARQELLAAGYKTSVFFEGRKNGEAVWREEVL